MHLLGTLGLLILAWVIMGCAYGETGAINKRWLYPLEAGPRAIFAGIYVIIAFFVVTR